MSYEKVTVTCIYCKRFIDGHMQDTIPDAIVNLGSNDTIAIAGEYGKKKGFLHVSCKRGIEAEAKLQEKK